MAEPPVTFAALLRALRTDAGLTQEELAAAASLSPRSVSDLERGINLTARKETARLLADALRLSGAARAAFEAMARGRAPAGGFPAQAGPADGTTIRALPRDVASFTGREPELAQLLGTAAAGDHGVVGIHAIGGMAGVGKTAFAVRAAHQLAPRFPGGQIFLPLHGHTPGQQPTDPADALASLLLTVGVAPQQIPSGLEARMALWRDRLADRRLLLVLDDAADSDQVRPLLPGAGGSLVLVTSRRHLTALEDATAISLDTLPPAAAAELLVRLAARPALDPRDAAVGKITRLCGYLPLAVGMLARQLHHRPGWTLADLADDLAAARDRLELMTTENLSVAAAFDLSYRDLSHDQQRLFRRLGLHPGADIDAYACAWLDDTDLAAARRQLAALYDHYLLTEPSRGRYRLHDLIREHARALASREDAGEEREMAAGRLLDYYQRAAEAANRHIGRYTAPARAAAQDRPAPIPDLPDGTRALTWARAERPNLLACLDLAARTGQHARVVALTAALGPLLQRDGPWTDAVTRHAAAVLAARDAGDRLGEAGALQSLGVMRRLTGDRTGAIADLETALGIYRDTGDRLGEANALHGIGDVWRQAGSHPAAAPVYEQALGIYRDLGDRLGQANALNGMGDVRRLSGDYPGAARALEAALGIHRDRGDLLGQASVLANLGDMRRLTGDYQAAAQALAAALAISRDIGNRQNEAHALTALGIVRQRTGDHGGAAEALHAGLAIYRELSDPLGQANALGALGAEHQHAGDYAGAAEFLKQALRIYRAIGVRLGEAYTLIALGGVLLHTGDHPDAAEALDAALGICRDLGERGGETEALNEIGALYRARGDLGQAAAHYRQALDLAREIGSSWDTGHALAGLGRCARDEGRPAEAEDSLRQALEIFRQTGAAEAADVAAELDALRGAARPAPDPR